MMRALRFALAVLGTSVALVVAIGVIGIWAAPRVLAYAGFGPFGGPFADHALPPELQGLQNFSPAERFAHFTGAQMNVIDKDGKPMTIVVTPGKVSSASATGLTLTANDGSSKTFTLDDKTVVRGNPTTAGARPAAVTPKQGDLVVVVAKGGETTARFVMDGGTEGFGPPAGHGPWGPWRGAQ
jgi:hypothetical protein